MEVFSHGFNLTKKTHSAHALSDMLAVIIRKNYLLAETDFVQHLEIYNVKL
jgi:hypothetical protein